MRGQGRVYRPKVRGREVRTWWLDYGVDGQRFRESSHTTSKRAAQRLLRKLITGREAGEITGQPNKVTFADMRKESERQYDLDNNRSLDRLQDAHDHLERFFGPKVKARRITDARVLDYVEHRQAEGAAPATINYEKAALRRMFKLAKLATAPEITTPKVQNARQGFFTEGGFAALLLNLRDPLLVRYLSLKRLTGWRDNELRPLLWAYVDREAQEIRIPASDTKNRKALRFRYGLVPDAVAIVDALWEAKHGPYVFQRKGKPLKDYRTAWKLACRRAGLARTTRDPQTGELREELPWPHDLRRTAARDYRRYMSEQEIMDLCGWKTRSTFERYNITTPEDVDAGLSRRFNNGKHTANIEPAARPA